MGLPSDTLQSFIAMSRYACSDCHIQYFNFLFVKQRLETQEKLNTEYDSHYMHTAHGNKRL